MHIPNLLFPYCHTSKLHYTSDMQHKHHFLPCKDRGSVPKNLSSKENPRTVLKVFTKLNLNIVFSFQKEVTHTKIIRMDIVFNHLWEPFPRGKKHGFLGRLKRQKNVQGMLQRRIICWKSSRVTMHWPSKNILRQSNIILTHA